MALLFMKNNEDSLTVFFFFFVCFIDNENLFAHHCFDQSTRSSKKNKN